MKSLLGNESGLKGLQDSVSLSAADLNGGEHIFLSCDRYFVAVGEQISEDAHFGFALEQKVTQLLVGPSIYRGQ